MNYNLEYISYWLTYTNSVQLWSLGYSSGHVRESVLGPCSDVHVRDQGILGTKSKFATLASTYFLDGCHNFTLDIFTKWPVCCELMPRNFTVQLRYIYRMFKKSKKTVVWVENLKFCSQHVYLRLHLFLAVKLTVLALSSSARLCALQSCSEYKFTV